MIDFSGINFPFSVTDLLTTAMSILKVIWPVLVAGLGFVLNLYFMRAVQAVYAFVTHKGDSDNLEYVRGITTPKQFKKYKRMGRRNAASIAFNWDRLGGYEGDSYFRYKWTNRRRRK